MTTTLRAVDVIARKRDGGEVPTADLRASTGTP